MLPKSTWRYCYEPKKDLEALKNNLSYKNQTPLTAEFSKYCTRRKFSQDDQGNKEY